MTYPITQTFRTNRLKAWAATGILYPTLAIGMAIGASAMVSMSAHAQTAQAVQTLASPTVQNVEFQKKTYKLRGTVSVEQRGDKTFIVFSDDFRTQNGPDLKVFLSRNDVTSSTGTNATSNAIRLGELKSNRGAQDYELPAGVSLADFKSVLVHCEAFSKLWGGADLT